MGRHGGRRQALPLPERGAQDDEEPARPQSVHGERGHGAGAHPLRLCGRRLRKRCGGQVPKDGLAYRKERIRRRAPHRGASPRLRMRTGKLRRRDGHAPRQGEERLRGRAHPFGQGEDRPRKALPHHLRPREQRLPAPRRQSRQRLSRRGAAKIFFRGDWNGGAPRGGRAARFIRSFRC